MTHSFTREQFELSFDVPRGTMLRLDRYAALLVTWQEKMNLVGPATLSDIWGRHFADSAQLMRHSEQGKCWLDMGAGGGFPGLVLATLGWGEFILVDSIAKKCRFLECVREELGLHTSVTIKTARVEQLPTLGVDVATARAAASLDKLLGWGLRHVRPGGRYLFPKGKRWRDEVQQAQMIFDFDLEAMPSMTDEEARILIAQNVKRR